MRGPELEVRDFASVLATPPMMAEWRVVLVHGAEALAPQPAARKLVLDMAASPPEGLALILTATRPTRSRARFYRDIVRSARSLEFRPVRANDLPGFLVSWCRERHGAEMNEDAARALAGAVGSDMGVLAQEIAKLVAMVPTRSADYGRDGEGGRDPDPPPRSLALVRHGGRTRLCRCHGRPWRALHARRIRRLPGHGPHHPLPPHRAGARPRAVRAGGRASPLTSAGSPAVSRGRAGAGTARAWTAALLGLRRVDRLMKASALPHHHLLEEWLLAQRTSAGEAGRPRHLRARRADSARKGRQVGTATIRGRPGSR